MMCTLPHLKSATRKQPEANMSYEIHPETEHSVIRERVRGSLFHLIIKLYMKMTVNNPMLIKTSPSNLKQVTAVMIMLL